MNVLPLRVAEWIVANPDTTTRIGWILVGVGTMLGLALLVGRALSGEPRPSRHQRRKERGLVRQAELLTAHAARQRQRGTTPPPD